MESMEHPIFFWIPSPEFCEVPRDCFNHIGQVLDRVNLGFDSPPKSPMPLLVKTLVKDLLEGGVIGEVFFDSWHKTRSHQMRDSFFQDHID